MTHPRLSAGGCQSFKTRPGLRIEFEALKHPEPECDVLSQILIRLGQLVVVEVWVELTQILFLLRLGLISRHMVRGCQTPRSIPRPQTLPQAANPPALGSLVEALPLKAMPQSPNLLDQAIAFHAALPDLIRRYLNGRGIPDATIDEHLLGWNGSRITIPIRNRAGNIAFFKLRKDSEDQSDSPKMLTTPGSHAELYGWERVLAKPESIVICEGEFDRLVLESRGFGAVTSTGGAGTFRPEWAEAFREIPDVYICFDSDEAGQRGAERVAQMIPHARIVRLPDDVGPGGDVTDFFVRLGRSREDFLRLMETASQLPSADFSAPPVERARVTGDEEVSRLKSLIRIEDIVPQYFLLRWIGRSLVGRCPFHEDRTPSFVVFPDTQTFYCFGCRAHGDVLAFLMRIEHLTFPEALQVCRRLSEGHE